MYIYIFIYVFGAVLLYTRYSEKSKSLPIRTRLLQPRGSMEAREAQESYAKSSKVSRIALPTATSSRTAGKTTGGCKKTAADEKAASEKQAGDEKETAERKAKEEKEPKLEMRRKPPRGKPRMRKSRPKGRLWKRRL